MTMNWRRKTRAIETVTAHLYLLRKNAWHVGVNKSEDMQSVPGEIRHSHGERSLMYIDKAKNNSMGNWQLRNTLYILEWSQIQEYRSYQCKHHTRFWENVTMYLTVLFLPWWNLKSAELLVHFRFVCFSRSKYGKKVAQNKILFP